jgi:hypothetical protein
LEENEKVKFRISKLNAKEQKRKKAKKISGVRNLKRAEFEAERKVDSSMFSYFVERFDGGLNGSRAEEFCSRRAIILMSIVFKKWGRKLRKMGQL